MVAPVEREYRNLLAREGLDHLLDAPGPFAEADAEIRETLAGSGVDVAGPTYVGEFPHRSPHAQARAVAGGTLILLDTGLGALLDRVATTTVASQLTFTTDEAGTLRYEVVTPQQHARRAEADAELAEAVLAYLHQGDPPPAAAMRAAAAPEDGFGLFMARSAERFAIGHEYGHLLAGHPHTPPDQGPDGLRREFEADELAALLILRGLGGSADFLWRGLAVAGPFLLLAVERLVTRVRSALHDLPVAQTHPPPEARAAALRRTLDQLGERTLLQVAEAWVSSLALREDIIVGQARRSARAETPARLPAQVRSEQGQIGR
jgi:hypothetical protein